MKPFLMYTELHVADRTFYIETVIYAKSLADANEIFCQTKTYHGKNYTLQPKGFLGSLTPKRIRNSFRGEDIAKLINLPTTPNSIKFITGKK